MLKNPLHALSLIAALAIGPSFVNALSGAYVKKLSTRNIMLSATSQGNLAQRPAQEQAAPISPPETLPATAQEPVPAAAPAAAVARKPESKAPFMALPARVLTGGMAAREIEVLETLGGTGLGGGDVSLLQRSSWPSRQNWETHLSRRSPDPSNLTPAPGAKAADADSFVYKIDKPLWHSSTVVFLLHGSGCNETGLIPFARAVWPRATLIGIRGRIMQGKERRWYSKITPTAFDQTEAAREADSLAQFIAALSLKNRYAPRKTVFVGYSNGANLLAILAMQYPQLVRRAVLLRPMPVLTQMPREDLHNLRILTLSGAQDGLYGNFAEPLYDSLRQNGANVVSYRIPATHGIGREDEKIITRWLKLGY